MQIKIKKHSSPAYVLSYIFKTVKMIDFRGNSCLKILNRTLLLCILYFSSFNINEYKVL